eukprot:TRINITY_DN1529_c0_g7_i1.p1 TRINITY_DN1529_c0_g7~~TRINITY_DN1529_c0_g7_i1.p1  ORF type:complete len:360 (+),score=39.68 TRINITY_DN1529_c0_g7_i1:50-1081(+)
MLKQEPFTRDVKLERNISGSTIAYSDGERNQKFLNRLSALLAAPFPQEENVKEIVAWMHKQGEPGELPQILSNKMQRAAAQKSKGIRDEELERLWMVLGRALLDLGKQWREAMFKTFAPEPATNRRYAVEHGYILHWGKFMPEGLESTNLLAQLEDRSILPPSVLASLTDRRENVSRALMADFDGDVDYFFAATQSELKAMEVWEYPVVTKEDFQKLINPLAMERQQSLMEQELADKNRPMPLSEQVRLTTGNRPACDELMPLSKPKVLLPLAPVSYVRSGGTALPPPHLRKRKAVVPSFEPSDDICIVGEAPPVLSSPQKKKRKVRKPTNFANSKEDAIYLD